MTVKKKRGRKPKSLLDTAVKKTSSAPSAPTVEGKRERKKISYTFDLEDEEIEDEEEEANNESSSDEEFKIDAKEDEEEDDEEEEESNDEDVDLDNKDDLEIIKMTKPVRSQKPSKRQTRSVKKSSPDAQQSQSMLEDTLPLDQDEDDTPLLDSFDMNVKIDEWELVLDSETKSFLRPKIPRLNDEAIKPFISPKSIPPKIIIYDCPFCKRIFTYSLVFKSHLYTCDSNMNTPTFNLMCAKHPECGYKRKKKSEVIQHFAKVHRKRLQDSEENSMSDDDGDYGENYYKTHTKQNQLEVSRYYYLERNELSYAIDYYQNYLGSNYKRLKFIDDFSVRYFRFKMKYYIAIKLFL